MCSKRNFFSYLHRLAYKIKHRKKTSFTLVELLLVIGILAILIAVIVLVINPVQLMDQTKDSKRLTDIQNIHKAIGFYQSLGNSNIGDTQKVYVSLPSATAPNCPSSLPSLPAGYAYECQSQQNFRNMDGTGWIPIDFTQVAPTLGSLFSSLPIDPVNTAENDFYYEYIPGDSWYLSVAVQSNKYKDTAQNDGGDNEDRYEIGRSDAISDNQAIAKIKQSCVGETLPCYTSLAAWQAAYGGIDFGACAQGNLVCLGKIAIAQIDGAWTISDTAPVIVSGWVTDAGHYIKIYTTTAARHSGKWDDTKYRMVASSAALINSYADFIYIDGLQVNRTSSNSGIALTSKAVPDTGIGTIISNCIIKGSGGGNYGILVTDGHGAKIFNNVVYGFNTYGIYIDYGGYDTIIYNNTSYGNGYGIKSHSSHIFLLKNNICNNNSSQDYYGTIAGGSINNISQDGSSPNPAFRYKIISFVSTASGNEDFHLLGSDTNAKDAGVDLSADSSLAFSLDFDGESRPFNLAWDIGADEWH